MATKKINFVEAAFKQACAKVFGEKLWKETATIGEGIRASNTDEGALDEDADIQALKAPAMYYQNGRFGLQLVLKFDQNRWGYAHLMHDKAGDPLIDENHTYDIKDVVAVREFAIPNSDGAVIAKGYELTKAYAATV